LLGGSFNPAHRGHLHVSREALRRLALDEVWWLVSPQNPLKPVDGMAPFDTRMASARSVARQEPRIKVTDLESRLGTRYTADTLKVLRQRFPKTRFVWLMGADNLAQIGRWDRWEQIFAAVPIAVIARPSYSLRSLNGKAARRFARYRLVDRDIRRLADATPPAWVFIAARLEDVSATTIRLRQNAADNPPHA